MRRTILAFLLLLFMMPVGAHPWKPRHYVIIDSDGGIDDLKAICLLMASPDVRILAITASDGYLKAPEAFEKIRTMADGLWHEGCQWQPGDDAIRLIDEALAAETTPVTFISMGPLHTAARMRWNSRNTSPAKVKQVLWTNSGLPGKTDLTTSSAPVAAEKSTGRTSSGYRSQAPEAKAFMMKRCLRRSGRYIQPMPPE
ncbi:MAG: nucleoside hydrolase [Marinilabiliales bacterium]|nr:nucleoside hydrolase [Marinilabiliales bacterium]